MSKALLSLLGLGQRSITHTSGTSGTIPANCSLIWVTLQGGGGSGQSITSNALGGCAGEYLRFPLAVTPGASYTYAIGAAGAGVANNDGNAGGNTTFTVDGVTYTAGGGARSSSTAGYTTASGYRVPTGAGGAPSTAGGSCAPFAGGAAAGTAGGGGATPFGRGSAGHASTPQAQSIANSGAGGGGVNSTGVAGSSGSAGRIVIEYIGVA